MTNSQLPSPANSLRENEEVDGSSPGGSFHLKRKLATKYAPPTKNKAALRFGAMKDTCTQSCDSQTSEMLQPPGIDDMASLDGSRLSINSIFGHVIQPEIQNDMDIIENEADVADKNKFRLLVLGSTKVGKSSLVNRFLFNTFTERYMPTIENFYKKIYRIKGDLYMLEMLDTSGCNPFPAMKRVSLQTGDLFMIVFSLTSPESWEEAKSLRAQIIDAKSTNLKKNLLTANQVARVPIVMVGNKADEDILVSDEEIQAYLQTLVSPCPYFDSSAKDDYGIEQAFFELFNLAHMPTEMTPAHHRRISPTVLLSVPGAERRTLHRRKNSRKKSLGKRVHSFRRRLSNVGMVSPVPRRPSVNADLEMAKQKNSQIKATDTDNTLKVKAKKHKKCVIM